MERIFKHFIIMLSIREICMSQNVRNIWSKIVKYFRNFRQVLLDVYHKLNRWGGKAFLSEPQTIEEIRDLYIEALFILDETMDHKRM